MMEQALTSLAAAGLFMVMISCNFSDPELGRAPLGPPDTGSSGSSGGPRLKVTASKDSMEAGSFDTLTIVAAMTDKSGNPLGAGDTVRFTSDFGIMDHSAVLNEFGSATAILHAKPVNGDCKITATVRSRNLSGSAKVVFHGLDLDLDAEVKSLPLGDTAEVDADLRDARGFPVTGEPMTFSVPPPGKLNKLPSQTFSTDAFGHVRVRLSASGPGVIRLKAAAGNAGDSVDVTFVSGSRP